jgi:hypothetical protein
MAHTITRRLGWWAASETGCHAKKCHRLQNGLRVDQTKLMFYEAGNSRGRGCQQEWQSSEQLTATFET